MTKTELILMSLSGGGTGYFITKYYDNYYRYINSIASKPELSDVINKTINDLESKTEIYGILSGIGLLLSIGSLILFKEEIKRNTLKYYK